MKYEDEHPTTLCELRRAGEDDGMKAIDLFITGTDTGVGKTVVAAALLSILRAEGIDAVPMKPVQTGCIMRDGGWAAPDLEFCLAMAGLKPAAEEAGRMAPYCFEPACSPHLAAARCGATISLERILNDFHYLKSRHEAVIVEGAGGVLVPIAGDKTMLELMVMLALPVVLVSRPGLGTINHTLLSLRELDRAGLQVSGVVFNETRPESAGYIAEDNRATIERMGKVRVLGHLPFLSGLDKGGCSPKAFHEWATKHLASVSLFPSSSS